MISLLLCPIGTSHPFCLCSVWFVIIASLLMYLLYLAAQGSHLLFTFPPASLVCFCVCVGASSTSTFCRRPQDLVPKPRAFPEHQLWFTALKSHFYADDSQICTLSPDPSPGLLTVSTWVSEKSQTQHVQNPQCFLPNCVPHSFPCLSWWHLQSFQLLRPKSLAVIFRLLLHTLQEILLFWNIQSLSCSPLLSPEILQ